MSPALAYIRWLGIRTGMPPDATRITYNGRTGTLAVAYGTIMFSWKALDKITRKFEYYGIPVPIQDWKLLPKLSMNSTHSIEQ